MSRERGDRGGGEGVSRERGDRGGGEGVSRKRGIGEGESGGSGRGRGCVMGGCCYNIYGVSCKQVRFLLTVEM